METRIVDLLTNEEIGLTKTVEGWVRTKRNAGNFSFIEINDGSSLTNLQILVGNDLPNYKEEIKKVTTGCALSVTGELTESPAEGQKVELHARTLEVIGWADPQSYPLQKKRHSFEYLRDISHLRPRTNALGAVTRVRSRLSYSVHTFFQERGFIHVHTPIITTSDCEGAGEMFSVSAGHGEAHSGNGEFFGKPAGLTVSGQLQAEVYALSFRNVYTFGPTFRAENSNTSRHLAEFWMIEPEIAFCDLEKNMHIAEELLKYLLSDILEQCGEDMQLFDRYVSKGVIDKLETVAGSSFGRVTYTEAIKILSESTEDFVYPVAWGIDLQTEHERYLTEQVFKKPLIVTDYPSSIKPFYMRLNEDTRTVAAMDVLVPGIGEIIGGSQREERHDVLHERMVEAGIDIEEYQWYLDLRKYGSVPHSGFGLGFERLVQYVTGMANIREVIPFPRAPGYAPC